MNRLQYRIVFNRQRGQLMAVAETARRQGKAAGQTASTGRRRSRVQGRNLRSLVSLSAAVTAGFVPVAWAPFVVSAQAQVVADPSAPKAQQPTVLNSANGTPQVNIQTPSAAGVSRNTYRQFDVDSRGVILNNSRTDTSTQLGGWVQANPWLAKGSARVILNEVNSSQPSQLKGYLEVAGQKAELIVANPAGIQVDGAGFINAGAAVLTTGSPRFAADGSVSGFAVQGGLIRIDGKGLDGTRTDYTALLARAIELNAGFWAQVARMQTGTQMMTADLSGGGETLTATGAAPRYALDSTALGGIYAQRITLIGTEAGLGVRQAGQVIGGQLTLRADGWLDNTGTIYAQDPGAAGVPALKLESTQGVRNAGWIAARGDVDLRAAHLIGESGSVSAAGMSEDGKLVAGSGTLSLTSTETSRQAGDLLASKSIAVHSETVDLDHAQAQAATVEVSGDRVSARQALIVADRVAIGGRTAVDLSGGQFQAQNLTAAASAAGASLHADGALLSAAGTLAVAADQASTRGATLVGSRLEVAAHDLDLSQAEWLQTGAEALALHADGTVNADGARIASNGVTLSVQAGELSAVAASLEQYGSGAMTLEAGTLDLRSATLWSNGGLAASGGTVTLDSAQAQARSIEMRADGVLSQKSAALRSTGSAVLAADRIDNRGGLVAADAGLAVQAGSQLINDGGELQSAAGSLAISGQADISNRAGLIAARDGVSLQARSLTQSQAATLAGHDVTLTLAGALNQDADGVTGPSSILASGELQVRAGTVTSRGVLHAQDRLDLSAAGDAELAGSVYGRRVTVGSGADLTVGGLLGAQGDVQAVAGSALQVAGDATVAAGLAADGRAGSAGTLVLSAGAELAAHGELIAANATLSGQRLDLSGGQLYASQALGLRSGGELVTEDARIAAGSLSLQAQDWRHSGGRLTVSGEQALNVDLEGRLDNRGGLVSTGGELRLAARQIDNHDGELSARQLGIETSRLDNGGQGLIAASGSLNVEAGSLGNSGTLQALGDLALRSAGQIDNGGLIRAQGSASVQAGTLNQTGTLAAGTALTVQAGTIDSSGSFVSGLRPDNSLGAQGELRLSATQVLRQSGTTLAAGEAMLDAASLQMQGSHSQAGRLNLQSRDGDVDLRDALLVSTGEMNLKAAVALDTRRAQLSAASVDLSARDWRHAGGEIGQTDASGSFAAKVDGTLDNQGGRIGANGSRLTVAAGHLDNSDGRIVHSAQAPQEGGDASELRIEAGSLVGSRGEILGGAAVTVAVSGTAELGQATTQGQRVSINADVLSLRGAQVLAQSTVQLAASQELNNDAGLIHGGGAVEVQAGTLSNRDGQIGGERIVLQGGRVDNAGQGLIVSTRELSVDVERLDNAGQLRAGTDADLKARAGLGNTGLIHAQGDVHVQAGSLNHDGMLAAGGDVAVTAATLDSQGTFVAGLKADNTLAQHGKLTIAAQELQLHGSALAGDRLSLSATELLDTGASSLSAGSVAVEAASWRHAGGELAQTAADGSLELRVAGQLDNHGGRIAGNAQSATLQAQSVDNQSGRIVHAGTGTLAVSAGQWAGADGQLLGAGEITLAVGGHADLDRAVTQGDKVTVTAGTLSHRAAQLLSAHELGVDVAGRLDNTGGLLQAAGDLALHAGAVVNDDGRIDGRELRLHADGAFSNAGDSQVTASQSLVLQAAQLSNAGSLQAQGSASLDVAGTFDNTGTVYAQGPATVTAGGTLTHAGLIASQGSLTVRADAIAGTAGSSFAAGLAPDGTQEAQAELRLSAARSLQHAGQMQAGGLLSADAATLQVQGSRTAAGAVTLDARSGDLRLDGASLAARERLALSSAAVLNTEAARLSGADVGISAADWRHSGGQIGQTGAAGTFSAAIAGTLDNHGGSIVADGASMTLSARTLDNTHGRIGQAGDGRLQIDVGTVTAAQGEILAAGHLALNVAGAARLDGARTQAQRLDLAAQTLSHREGELVAQDAARLQIAGELDNRGGLLHAGGSLDVRADSLLNRDGQIGAVDVSLSGARLDNGGDGLVMAQGSLVVDTGRLDNGGSLRALGDATLRADAVTHSGVIAAGGALDLRAGSVASSGSFAAGLRQDGSIAPNGDLTIAASGSLQHSGAAVAGGSLSMNAAELALQDSQLQAAQVRLDARSGDLRLDRASVAASDRLTLAAAGTLDSSQAELGAGSVSIDAAAWRHLGGQLAQTAADGQFGAVVSGRLDNQGGTIAANAATATIRAAELDNRGGNLVHAGSDTLSLDLQRLDGGAGRVLGNGRLVLNVTGQASLDGATTQAREVELSASSLSHRDAELLGQAGVVLDVAGSLDNTGGLLQSAGELRLEAGALDNRDGQIDGRTLHLSVSGAVNNGGHGLVSASQSLNLQAGQLQNAGSLQSQGAGELLVQGSFANTGSVYASAPLTVAVDGALSHSGLMASGGALDARAAGIASSGSFVAGLSRDNTLAAAGDLRLSTTGTLQHDGQTIAAGSLELGAASLQLQNAALQARQADLNARAGDLRLDGATVAVGGALSLTASGALDTRAATVDGGTVAVDALRWNHAGGVLTQTQAAGSLKARVREVLDNTGGEIAAAGSTLELSAGALDNDRGRIVHAGSQSLRIDAGSLSGVGGEILGAHAVTLAVAGDADLRQASTQAQDLVLQAARLQHQGGQLLAGGDARLDVKGALDNTGGMLVAGGDLQASSTALVNDDGQIVGRDVVLSAGSVDNRGQGLIGAQGSLAVDAGQLTNAGVLQAGGDARLAVSGNAAQSGLIRALGTGSVVVGGSFSQTGTVATAGALSVEAGALSGAGTFVAGLRADNTLAAGQDLSVRASGTLQSAGTMLAGGQLTLTGRELQLQDSRLQGAKAALTSTDGALRLDGAELASTGELKLASAGLLQTDGAALSGGSVEVRAADWRNVAGSVSQVGAGGRFTADLSGRFVNTDGHLAAGGAALQLGAQHIDNTRGTIVQAGSGPLSLRTATLDGAGGQILSNGALTIDATGALNLSGAQTQGAGVVLKGASLDHRAGNLVSTGAAELAISGALDNRGGTIASAGALQARAASVLNGAGGLLQSDAALAVTSTGTLDNQGGRLRSGGAMTLDAGSFDNRAGWVGSDGSLHASSGSTLLNTGGSLLAQQGVSLEAAALSNQQGQIASLQGDVAGRFTGAIDNTQGSIQAAQALDLASSSLGNRQGEVAGGRVSIDTHGQALDNRGGRLLASQSLTVDGGALDNQGGLLQSLGALSVQTHGVALNNTRDATVTTPTGIHAVGSLSLDSGTLLNEAGISAGADGHVRASQLTNRGELSAAALDLAVAGTLDNQGSRLIGTQSLTASAQQVLNQGGLIYGGQTLTLAADGLVDNRGNAGGAQGIQGGHVAVQAQQLDNAGGQVLANGNLQLTLSRALDNGGGALGAGGWQQIGDGRTASALSLTNAGGRIWSGDTLALNLGQLVGGVAGELSSGGDLALRLAGDFSYGAGSSFKSRGDMVLTFGGDFSNQGSLRSGAALKVDAANIDNRAGAELSGTLTALNATGALNNRGLVDGDGVVLTADRLNNLGSGRIYGGDIVLDGGQLLNAAEGGVGAVIAARRTLDGELSRDISNTDGALIFADGDMRLVGASLLNENATIEASRSLLLQTSGDIVNRTVLPGVSTGQEAGTGGTGGGSGGGGGGGRGGGSHQYQMMRSVAYNTYTRYYSGVDPVEQQSTSSTASSPRLLQTKAFIRSGGDMQLSAANLLNSGATIEARGDLLLRASEIRNVNPYLMWGGYTGSTTMEATQSLAARIVVGGQLLVQDAKSITNDMSQVVGGDGVAIIGGSVNNVAHMVSVVDAQGVTRQVRLVLPNSTQSYVPAALPPADRTQAGAVTTAGGATAQQANGQVRVAAGKTGGLSGLFGRLLRSVKDASAVQPDAQATAGWQGLGGIAVRTAHADARTGEQAVAQVQQHDATLANAVVVSGAHGAGSAVAVSAGSGNTRDGTPVAAPGATLVHNTLVVAAPAHDASTTAAQAVVSAGPVAPMAQAELFEGRSAVARSLRALAAARAEGSAQAPQLQATSTATTTAPTAQRQPEAAQGVTLRGSGATFQGKPLAHSVQVNLTPPANTLFRTHSEPGSHYLVETDPRFADYRSWLSSDYLLQALALDPATTQKRLGDGFYEQRLVREQIGQLTGTGYISGYSDDEAMYRALLTNGATFAKEHQLVPGVALTREQMTQLTSDLVWLVEQEVTLADGSVQRVLVPQVYLVPRDGDLQASGSLIAGGRVEMALSGDLANGGDVRGGVVAVEAQNVANTGDMRATTLALSARDDLRNIGGSLAATGDMSLTAGRDIVMETTTASGGTHKGRVTTRATVLDQVASLSAGGVMLVKAGQDVTLQAVQIKQGAGSEGAGGSVLIDAGRDLTLDTVQTASARDEVKNAKNYKKESQSQDVGTVLQAQGDVLLNAGHDLSATAATVKSEQGTVALSAAGDVSLLAGEANTVFEQMKQKTKRSAFKKKKVTTYNKTDETTAIGTTLSGTEVAVVAGEDIELVGAQVVSDLGTTLKAGHDVLLDAAADTLETTRYKKTVKSGLFSGGGIGVTIGKQELAQAKVSTEQTNVASTVASVGGNVTIVAGEDYRQVGSNLTAPGGDVSVKARSIEIVESRNLQTQNTKTEFKQSGVTLSVSVPGVSAALGAVQAGQNAGQTEDSRMKALAAATALSKALEAQKQIEQFRTATEADKQKSVSISLSVGSSRNRSEQTNTVDQAAGSEVLAGGRLALVAAGDKSLSDVTVRGSTLAGQDVLIEAADEIRLEAARNLNEQHSRDKGSSASIGIGISLGSDNKLGVTVSGSVSRGKADGTDLSHTVTQVSGGSTVTLKSGGDTALQGAVVTAPQVLAEVGRDLKIESLQDTAKYDSKSQSVGGSVTFGYGAGGNANYSGSKVNADYAAVGEQAGIRAGDGGFQVNVAGATELIGGAITSSQAAIDAGKNRLTTATLEARDIANRSQFSASAVTVSAGTSGGMAGAYKDSGDDRSTTRSTISAGQTVLSAADEASRAVLEGLDRGATNDATTGKLAQGWDGQKLQQQSRLNAQIVADFGAEASQRVGSLAETKMVQAEKLKLEAEKLPEGPERDAKLAEAESLRAAWDVDGSARVALHATIGALTGDVAGMLGGASSPIVAARVAEYLEQAGADAETTKLVMSIASTVVGGVLGGAEGSAAAFNEVRNNATSLSPFASVRSAVRNATAVLENQCGSNCTEQDYREIDAKVRRIEAAATTVHVVALGGGVSPEDAQRIGQVVVEMLPVYGTAEAVLQVLTGKSTLTGEEVSRYAAALGAIPIAGPVLKRMEGASDLARVGAREIRWKLGVNDIDFRGSGKGVQEALDAAFEKLGIPKSDFTVTEWGRDANGKSFPTEWRHTSGAEVNIDWAHDKNGPDVPHVGFQTGGKRGNGGAVRGHILLDDIPFNR